ncbi:hypothetical protein NLJ89_g10275 [Agrocybe chaxingu]|uniref:Uncharacterized protein n=1 Tax=Agrocybe chaxingu TaxID=84603 RepID=A0A9W8JUH3_9AGAR|nr:hypothetical protein NLJ89_g10275 [Agrocybe chaxingu]
MASKRPRKSGLSGAELAIAVTAIQALRDKSRQKQTLNTEEVSEEDKERLRQLEAILAMLQSGTDVPQTRFIAIFVSWSVSFHEQMKPRHVCGWNNAFFFRADAMTPSGSNMVLSVEQAVLSGTLSAQSLSGYIGLTAIATSSIKAQRLLRQPFLRELKEDDSVLFVSEATGPDQRLENHVAQAVGEMHRCARTAGKTTIRGVLTSGRGWIFLILKLNADGNGGSYLESDELTISREALGQVSKTAASLLSAIIAHWMKHSHEELDEDD